MDIPARVISGAEGRRLSATEWIVFDLFGTLVPQFPRTAHDRVLEKCSRIVGIDPAHCLSAWLRLYDRRVTGQIKGIAGHLLELARELGLHLDPHTLERARLHYRSFVPQLVAPIQGALDVLSSLRDSGAKLGLLSNAHDDVADYFAESELAPCFTFALFSCRIGHRKPDPRTFAAVLSAIGTDRPRRVTFVGDGSDNELAGAAAAGLRPVLVRSDLSDAYDPDRPEVSQWRGPAIEELAGLPALLRP